MPEFTVNIPTNKVEMVGRAYGIVKENDETMGEALIRLKAALIWSMKRPVIQMVKREREAANVVADTDDAITEI